MSDKAVDDMIKQCNDILAELHKLGVSISTKVEHPLPAINPCAKETRLSAALAKLASECQCCSGARILAALVVGLVVGVWL